MTSDNQQSPASIPPPAAAKSRTGKIIKRIVLAVVLLIVIALVALYFAIDPLVKRGVVNSSQKATDLETALNTASVSLFQGTLQLAGLETANAKDYKEPHFLTMNKCDVIVETPSLFTSVVQIDRIDIDGLEITLEVTMGPTGVKSNLADILETIKKNTATATTTGTPATATTATDTANTAPGKSLKIGSITLSRTKVHIRVSIAAGLPKIPGQFENLDLELEPLTMKDPTNPDGRMEKIEDLVGDVLIHVAKQIMDNPKIRDEIKSPMKGVMASVQGKFNKEFQKLGKDIPQDIQKEIQKDIQKELPKGIGDLLNPKPPATQK